jgi:serine/threonine protein kinase
VHRDIKPENIFLVEGTGSNGGVKILDFGIARIASSSRFTQTAMAVGTAYYMAPEQMRAGTPVDARADQYALAVIVYETISGRPPAGMFRPLASICPEVTKELSDAIDKALSADPNDRHFQITGFTGALQDGLTPRKTGAGKFWAIACLLAVCAGGAGATGFYIPSVRSYLSELIYPPAPAPAVAVPEPKVQLRLLAADFNPEQKLVALKWSTDQPAKDVQYQIKRSDTGRPEDLFNLETISGKSSFHPDKQDLRSGREYLYRVVALAADGSVQMAISNDLKVQLPDWVAEEAARAEAEE